MLCKYECRCNTRSKREIGIPFAFTLLVFPETKNFPCKKQPEKMMMKKKDIFWFGLLLPRTLSLSLFQEDMYMCLVSCLLKGTNFHSWDDSYSPLELTKAANQPNSLESAISPRHYYCLCVLKDFYLCNDLFALIYISYTYVCTQKIYILSSFSHIIFHVKILYYLLRERARARLSSSSLLV